MNKTSKISLSLLIIVILGVLFQLIYSYSNIDYALFSKIILSENEKVQFAIKNNSSVECKFNFVNPKYAFVTFHHYIYLEDNVDMRLMKIDFYDLSRNNIFSKDWNIQRTGGTTIENTTFPELVEMVKEDCFQFQQSKGDFNDEIINWSYSEYIPQPPKQPKAVRTDEEEAEWQEMMLQRTIEIGKKTKRIEAEIISE